MTEINKCETKLRIYCINNKQFLIVIKNVLAVLQKNYKRPYQRKTGLEFLFIKRTRLKSIRDGDIRDHNVV